MHCNSSQNWTSQPSHDAIFFLYLQVLRHSALFGLWKSHCMCCHPSRLQICVSINPFNWYRVQHFQLFTTYGSMTSTVCWTSVGVWVQWTGVEHWTTRLDYWTGLLDWTTGLDYWTGLLDWTTRVDNWTGLLDWPGLYMHTTYLPTSSILHRNRSWLLHWDSLKYCCEVNSWVQLKSSMSCCFITAVVIPAYEKLPPKWAH